MNIRKNIERINLMIIALALDGFAVYFCYTRGYIVTASLFAIPFIQSLALLNAFSLAALLKYILLIKDSSEKEKPRVDITRLGIAKLYLELLKEGQEREPEHRLALLLDEAQKGNFTLKDIGTSKEELDILVAECYHDAALYYLRRLRNTAAGKENPVLYPLYVDALLTTIERGNIALKKLATNEKEILSFQTRAAPYRAGS
jgi:hypothetical protein